MGGHFTNKIYIRSLYLHLGVFVCFLLLCRKQSTPAKEAVIGPSINQINHCRAAVPAKNPAKGKCPLIWEEPSHIWFPGYKNLITENLGVKLSFVCLPELITFIYEENHPIAIKKNVLPVCILNTVGLSESLNKDTNSK